MYVCAVHLSENTLRCFTLTFSTKNFIFLVCNTRIRFNSEKNKKTHQEDQFALVFVQWISVDIYPKSYGATHFIIIPLSLCFFGRLFKTVSVGYMQQPTKQKHLFCFVVYFKLWVPKLCMFSFWKLFYFYFWLAMIETFSGVRAYALQMRLLKTLHSSHFRFHPMIMC